MTEEQQHRFYRGCWFAFDAVLSYLNTLDTLTVDKKALYGHIIGLRPQAIYQHQEGLTRDGRRPAAGAIR